MSTIASLLSLIDPGAIKPFGEAYEGIERSRRENETGLIALAEAKQKQAAEARMLEAIQNDPEVRQRLFGTIGSLPTTASPGAPPAPGPMTQQQVMPGQPPGAPQTVPGGQDLSRFAGVSPQGGGPLPAGVGMPTVTPPQSTIGSLGPAGQPQGPAPRNPVLEMARTDPRVAMMLQQQIEGQQDAAMKRQEQNLKLGAATLGYVGQQAQGVTDQASLDALRSDLQSQGLGKYAAQLPQLYSKDAMQPFIAKAVDVEKSLTLQVQTMAAQAELAKARMSGRVAKTDQYLKALGVAPGTETASDMEKALAWQQRDEIMVSQMHGAGQLKDTSLGVTRIRPGGSDVEVIRGPDGQPLQPKPSETEQKGATLANSVAAANKLATDLEDKGYRPSVWEKGVDKLAARSRQLSDQRRLSKVSADRAGICQRMALWCVRGTDH